MVRKKRQSQALGVCLGLLLIIVVLLTVVEYAVFDMSFFQREYVKLATADNLRMSEQDLLLVTEKLLAYIQGKAPDLEMQAVIDGAEQEVFNAREKDHMVDVRKLYEGAFWVRNLCVTLWLVGMTYLWQRWGRRYACSAWGSGFLRVIAGSLLVFGALGFFISQDFTRFWDQFHYVFFSNDLWQLNPSTDRMIVMVPEPFFFNLAVRILKILAGSLCFLSLLSVAAIRRGH